MKHALTRIVGWSHELLAEVVVAGDLAVDLTAGNGHDALMLFQLVGESGRVVAFDIQDQALQSTEQRLKDAGAVVHRVGTHGPLLIGTGVSLIAACHSEMGRYLSAAPKAIVANLGYLPGGDQQLITRPETTRAALLTSCELLAPGGRLAVVVYPEHAGGREEAARVDTLFRSLSESEFDVLCLRVGNRRTAPYLQVAEKRLRAKHSK